MSHTAAFLTSNQVTLAMSMAAQVWHELRNVLMVMILLMLYLVLWVPYIVMAKGDQVAGVQPALPRSASSGTRTRWRFTGT